MENKKLLILASIRQPMADHSNKVQCKKIRYIMIKPITDSHILVVFSRRHWFLFLSQVKKCVIQVISAMAHHGYLELEGGELLVRFIVQHCALPDTHQVLNVNFSSMNHCFFKKKFSESTKNNNFCLCLCSEDKLLQSQGRWLMRLWGRCVTTPFISWPPLSDD